MAHGRDFDPARPEGFARLRRLSEVSGRPVCWGPIVQTIDRPDAWTDQLERFRDAQAEGQRVFSHGFTQPDDFEFRFTQTNVFDRWPGWQKLLMSPRVEKLRAMRDPAQRSRLREEMRTDPLPVLPVRWDRIVLVGAATDRYKDLQGSRVADIAHRLGRDPLDVAFDIALDEDLQTHFRLLDARNPDDAVPMQILGEPHIAAGFTDAGAHLMTEVSTGFCTHLLGHWVRDKSAISLEAAVRAITGVPAAETGIADRGLVQPGMRADLTLFDLNTVGALDREFVDDLPTGASRLIQRARGIEYVLVNGQVSYRAGQPTGALPGRVLRPPSASAD